MKTLNLHRVWEVLNFVIEQEDLFNEKDIYPNLLGLNSNYYKQDFNHFLEHYSFSIRNNEICIFNDDQVPYEDFTINDFSYIPKELLEYNNNELMTWVYKQLNIHIKTVNEKKQKEKEDIKKQIKILTERLEKLL